ncbi:MAG: hypothetical protein ABII12_16100 [Planctomycetota bacterium]
MVWLPIEATPRLAAFNRISANAATDGTLLRKLTIVNNVDEEANITNIRSTSPMFKAECSVLEPGKKFELTVSLVPPFRPGNNSASIELSTGLNEMPELKVPAQVYITAEVDVMPPKLVLRPGRTSPLTRQVSVKNNSGKPMVVSDVQASNPRIKTTLSESIAGMQYKIDVSIPTDYDVPESGDKITFKTDVPAMPFIEVPVEVVAARGAAKRGMQPVIKRAPTNTREVTKTGLADPTPRKFGEKPAAAKEARQPEKATPAAKPIPRDKETGGETQ